MTRILGILLVLTACVRLENPNSDSQRNAEPVRAFLYPSGLNVIMSDGTFCSGHRPGRVRNWTGQLSGCPHLLPYTVSNYDPTLPRQELQRVSLAPDSSAIIAGMSFAKP